MTLFDELDTTFTQTNLYENFKTYAELEQTLWKLWKIWTCVESRSDEDWNAAGEYFEILKSLSPIAEAIKNSATTIAQL